jgi:hypothetical protein
LKAHGVTGRKPLHALRKEYGSLINEKYDLVTAKELLRHSSVAITAAHYVENRKRGKTGLGAVLVKRQRKGEGKKISELGSNNGRIGPRHQPGQDRLGRRKGEKTTNNNTNICDYCDYRTSQNRLDKKRNAKTNMGALQESLPSRTF